MNQIFFKCTKSDTPFHKKKLNAQLLIPFAQFWVYIHYLIKNLGVAK